MKNRLQDVLVVVPLTEEGKIALKQAIYLRKLLSVRIFVLQVISPPSFFTRYFNRRKVTEIKNRALLKLTDFVTDFFGGEIPDGIILKVSVGNLVKTIIRQTQSGDFFFSILKKSKHRKGVSNLLDQSEIDKIIGHSQCPVLSINEDSTPPEIKNIVIPIDISEHTTKKLLWASMFAKKTHAKIRIVSALNINMDEQKSLALKNAEKIRTMMLDRGIECDVELLKVQGQILHEMVLSYIANQKPDFVVIRKHQLSSYSKTTIGDFAKEIIHGSGIPVFTVGQSSKDIAQMLP